MRATPAWVIVWTVIFGSGWGLGGIFFGLGVSALGLSLGTSAIMGLIAIGGSVVPLLLQHHGQLLSRSGIALLAGIFVMIIGLIVCARAGSLKAADQNSPAVKAVSQLMSPDKNREERFSLGENHEKVLGFGPHQLRNRSSGSAPSFGRGAFYCIAAGLLSALVNFALIFGAPLAQAAIDRGTPPAAANNAIWAIVFATNYLLNIAYCVYLGRKRSSFIKFMLPSTGYYWLLAVAMGLLWAGGIVVYGLGASMQGAYGPVFAFPVMLIVSILTGNLTGVLLGEWRGVTPGAKRAMQLGVVIMVAAIIILGCANSWTR